MLPPCGRFSCQHFSQSKRGAARLMFTHELVLICFLCVCVHQEGSCILACTLTTGRTMALCVDSTTRPTRALREMTGSSSAVSMHHRDMITHVYPRECKCLVYMVTTPTYVFKLLSLSDQLSTTLRLFFYYSDDKVKQENPHI